MKKLILSVAVLSTMVLSSCGGDLSLCDCMEMKSKYESKVDAENDLGKDQVEKCMDLMKDAKKEDKEKCKK